MEQCESGLSVQLCETSYIRISTICALVVLSLLNAVLSHQDNFNKWCEECISYLILKKCLLVEQCECGLSVQLCETSYIRISTICALVLLSLFNAILTYQDNFNKWCEECISYLLLNKMSAGGAMRVWTVRTALRIQCYKYMYKNACSGTLTYYYISCC